MRLSSHSGLSLRRLQRRITRKSLVLAEPGLSQYAALILALIMAGCASPTPMSVTVAPTLAPTQTLQPTHTTSPTLTPSSTATAVPPTATATATPSPTTTPTSTATPTRVPTVRPTVATVATPSASSASAPPSGMIFAAPRLVQPPDGVHLKTVPRGGGYGNSITFEWLPVGALEKGQVRCTWKNQPNGTEAAFFDRYIVKLDPPLPRDTKTWRPVPPVDSFTDMGTKIIVELGRFQLDTTYTWRVAVGRWCIVTLGYPQEGFVGLVSPFSESRTFKYSP